MTTAPIRDAGPELPRPGQKVRWRRPEQARAWGWEAVFGPDPFEVVAVVDRSAYGLAAGLLLDTRLGRREISAIWFTPADEPPADNTQPSRAAVSPPACRQAK
jgi:hypothetical protein